MRLAVIPIYTLADSRFGLNHAFGWPELLTLSHQAGLVWNRNWSLKWQDVEPSQGQFTFDRGDAEINRLLRRDFHVLGLLPFPSSMWSSSAPANVQPSDPWYYPLTQSPDRERQREEIAYERGSPALRMSYAPRNMAEFENYIGRTVAHYKDRVHDWQVFNEPVLSGYALYKGNGYGMADYIHYIEVVAKVARRTDPKCRILGGFSVPGFPAKKEHIPEAIKEMEPFIALGGLKSIDVFTLHIYPADPPEFIESLLQQLNAAMDRHGVRRPIWFTECAYFADDEPWATPITNPCGHLPKERDQAGCLVKMSTILFANGVEKIFFHSGIGSGINHTNPWTMFLRYGGEPYQCYASQAVMSQLLTPTCTFVKRLLPDQPTRVYLFRDLKRTLAVVWAPTGTKKTTIHIGNAGLHILDLMGREQTAKSFVPTELPVYVIGENITTDIFEKSVY
jgi:hypothetical protein